DLMRRHGVDIRGKTHLYRWAFNLACCSLCTWPMYVIYSQVNGIGVGYPVTIIADLFSIAVVWFVVNTTTLSLALALSMRKAFKSVWREGIVLYLLNFIGSAAAAGLTSIFYDRAGLLIFFLSIPIAAILYKLHHFYVEKYVQAQTHISELNKLYLQTVEALA